jgi:DNA-binding GntR family transcriptional regulator
MVRRIVTSRNIRGKVYLAVRDYIASKEVAPGNKINEDELARNLGVSKTPVRDALSKLAHDGLVEIVPNRGAFKVKLSQEDIAEIMTVREVLEGLAVRLASKNMTEKIIQKLRGVLAEFEGDGLAINVHRYPEAHQTFQGIMHRASNSPRLVRVLQSMYDLTYMISLEYFSDPQRVRRSVSENKRLLDALEKGEVDLAEEIRKQLVRFAREVMTTSKFESSQKKRPR